MTLGDLGEKLNEKEDFNDPHAQRTNTLVYENNIKKLQKSIKVLQNVSK